ncbi:MAG TPA: hypothetical protein VF892_20575, partial [Pseudonocardiaceae bacterium]
MIDAVTTASHDDQVIADLICDGVDRWFGNSGDRVRQLHDMQRAAVNLVPTWLGALRMRAVPLDAASISEIDAAAHRQRTYRDLAGRLRAMWPRITVVKGETIARHYPDGIPRYSNDLDLTVPDPATAFAVAAELDRQGWRPETLTVHEDAGRTEVLVVLSGPSENPLRRPYAVEVSSSGWVGNRMGVPSRHGWPGSSSDVSTGMVALSAERLERPFGLRDILDCSLLLSVAQQSDIDAFVAAAEDVDIAPESRELLLAVCDYARTPEPARVVLARLDTRRARRHRAARAARVVRGPRWGLARLAQHMFLFHGQRQHWNWLLSRLTDSVPGATTTRHGLVAWGVAVVRGTGPIPDGS